MGASTKQMDRKGLNKGQCWEGVSRATGQGLEARDLGELGGPTKEPEMQPLGASSVAPMLCEALPLNPLPYVSVWFGFREYCWRRGHAGGKGVTFP